MSLANSFQQSFNSADNRDGRKKLLSNQVNKSLFNSFADNIASKYDKQEKILDMLKTVLSASNVTFQDFFNKIDKSGEGIISNLEFVNAIKQLKLGITLQEIEDLVASCDKNNDGKISFFEFMKQLHPTYFSLVYIHLILSY